MPCKGRGLRDTLLVWKLFLQKSKAEAELCMPRRRLGKESCQLEAHLGYVVRPSTRKKIG